MVVNVLVTYASKHGSTTEVAKRIAQALESTRMRWLWTKSVTSAVTQELQLEPHLGRFGLPAKTSPKG
jgi:menaquinone-dependent protoporphyrinogen IX oxidase